jgi:hypothetical protein
MSSTFRPPPRVPPENLQAWQRLAEESVIDDFGPSRHEGYHSVNERGPASPAAAAKSQASSAEAEHQRVNWTLKDQKTPKAEHQRVNWTLKDQKTPKGVGKKIHVEDPRSGRIMDKTRTQNAWHDMQHPAFWQGPRDVFENDPGPFIENTVENNPDPKGVYAGGYSTKDAGKKLASISHERTNSCIFPEKASPRTDDRLFPKRSQKAVFDEEKGSLVNLHLVSSRGPSHMKSCQDERLVDDANRQRHREVATLEMLNSARGRQANAGMRTDHAARQDRRGIKTNIKQDSGHIMNQTIVSTNSPDFMKKPFENNLAFFEEMGIVQKLTPRVGQKSGEVGVQNSDIVQKSPRKEKGKTGSTIHFDNSRNPVAGVRASLSAQDENSRLKHHITQDDNSKVCYRSMESRGAPSWMHCDPESDAGDKEELLRKWDAAGNDPGVRPKGKRTVIVNSDTGKVFHKSVKSAATPGWMKLGAVGAEHHAKDMWMQKISGRILDEEDEQELAVAHGQSNSGIRMLTECAVTGSYSLGEKFCHSKHAPDWFHGATLTSQARAQEEADLRSPNRNHNSSTMSSESCQSVASERRFVARLASKVNTSQKLKNHQTSTKTTSTRRSSSCSRSRRTSDATSYRSSGRSRSTCSINQSRRSSDLYSDWSRYSSSLPVQKEQKKANDQCDSPRRQKANDQCDSPRRHGHR